MEPKKLYFAGDLFDHKHLAGNALLAEKIRSISASENFPISPILPQDLEQATSRSLEIRNNDILTLMLSDLAFFNFDGTDLDSGTVVEFVMAKMMDIPSVIIRSDIRAAGDQLKDGDPWNLMVSGYTRTITGVWNAMALYQDQGVEGMHEVLASHVVEALQATVKERTFFINADEAVQAYYNVIKAAGSDMGQYYLRKSRLTIKELIASKENKGIYRFRGK